MSARFIVADVFDGLATLEDGTVDLVVTSPPFLALRSYLPADHPDKDREIGSESTPAEFLDTLLAVTAELRRVLAPHGSIAVELGDTYAGSGGAGGDYAEGGWREGQETWSQHRPGAMPETKRTRNPGDGWPLAKSKTLIPELYRIALAYGINPLTGQPSPAGRWRVRNVVTWCRPNPPVGALGDKWRPATSDVVVACVSDKRYWDDIATRRPLADSPGNRYVRKVSALDGERRPDGSQAVSDDNRITKDYDPRNSSGAPLLDYWEIPPGGYPGSHYAVFPPALVEPLVKAMAPPKVCRTCGEPSRRITETTNAVGSAAMRKAWYEGADPRDNRRDPAADVNRIAPDVAEKVTLGWSDCGCSNGHCSPEYACDDHWRPALILDCFAGSGTTLAVATGHGHDAIGIDLDDRNYALALDRVGPLLMSAAEGVSP